MKKICTRAAALFTAGLMILSLFSLAGCGDKLKNYRLNTEEVSVEKDKITSLFVMNHGDSADEYSTTWSSENTAVATVNDDGFVTGKGAGQTTVTAKITMEKSKKEALLTCKITVTGDNAPLEGISFGEASSEILVGGSFELDILFNPTNAGNKNVVFTSSDPEVVSVNSTTKLASALKLGTATITAVSEEGAFTAVKTIKVVEASDRITSLKLNKTEAKIDVGQELTLTAEYTPANEKGITVLWSCDDLSVATVSNDGVVTGVKDGKATITATIEDRITKKTATCTVTVGEGEKEKDIKAEKVTFDRNSIAVTAGDTSTFRFVAKVTPENTTETGTWSSSDSSVVSINEATGEMTVAKTVDGDKTVTITYKIGSVSQRGVVVVKKGKTDVVATSLTISQSALELTIGEEKQVSAVKAPTDAIDTITYISSNSAVATVDGTGKLIAVSEGTATITATANPSGLTATCTVTVKAKDKTPLSATLAASADKITTGQTETLTLTLPEEVSSENLAIKYSSDNPDILSVSKTDSTSATITAKAVGTATVTCTITDDSGKYIISCNSVTITVAAPAQEETE